MMTKLATMLGFKQEHSSYFYPQVNSQIKAVNKTLNTILKRTINVAQSNWHIMMYPALWAYRTNVKTTTGFSPFQLVHGVEAVTPVECEISSLKITIHVLPDTIELEERLLHLEHLDEHRRDALTTNEAHKNRVKNQYDNLVKPSIFFKGILSCSRSKTKNPWGQINSGLSG